MDIKGFLSLCLLALCFVITSCGKYATPAVWKVTGGASTVYLLGSVHVGMRSMYPLSPYVSRLCLEADSVYFETNQEMSIEKNNEIKQFLISEGKYKNRTTLMDEIGKDEFVKLHRIVRKKMPSLNINSYKPWALSQILDQMDIYTAGISNKYGFDNYLFHYAKQNGLDIKYLDDPEYTVVYYRLLNELSSLSEYELLQRFSWSYSRRGRAALREWSEGNSIKAMERLYNVSKDRVEVANEMASYLEAVVTKRNKSWIEKKIRPLLKSQGNYVIVAGTMHFRDFDGLPALLGNEGYVIEKVNY